MWFLKFKTTNFMVLIEGWWGHWAKDLNRAEQIKQILNVPKTERLKNSAIIYIENLLNDNELKTRH